MHEVGVSRCQSSIQQAAKHYTSKIKEASQIDAGSTSQHRNSLEFCSAMQASLDGDVDQRSAGRTSGDCLRYVKQPKLSGSSQIHPDRYPEKPKLTIPKSSDKLK